MASCLNLAVCLQRSTLMVNLTVSSYDCSRTRIQVKVLSGHGQRFLPCALLTVIYLYLIPPSQKSWLRHCLRTRTGRLKNSFVPGELSLPKPQWLVDMEYKTMTYKQGRYGLRLTYCYHLD